MLYEYAIEPELVATWSDRKVGRYFADKFGLGSQRIVSRYPKRWKKLVWSAWEQLQEQLPTGKTEIDHARMTELIEQLSEAMVKRTNTIAPTGRSWLNGTTEEHRRVPFYAILARRNPVGHPATLAADDLDERTPLWTTPRGLTIPRKAAAIADGRIPDFPVTRSHPPASWPSAANSSICRTYRKTAGEESRRRSPVANRWMRP